MQLELHERWTTSASQLTGQLEEAIRERTAEGALPLANLLPVLDKLSTYTESNYSAALCEALLNVG